MRSCEGVDFAMRAGEMVGLIGPNGSGKTTLAAHPRQPARADGGRVRYAAAVSAAEIGTARSCARQIAYLAQGGNVHWQMRVETVVALGRLPHRRPFRASIAPTATPSSGRWRRPMSSPSGSAPWASVSAANACACLLARALAVESCHACSRTSRSPRSTRCISCR